MRLACVLCDREDGDGVAAVPAGWLDVNPVHVTMREDWYDWLGYCPQCVAERDRPAVPIEAGQEPKAEPQRLLF